MEMTLSKIKSTLTDVPETVLWTLHNRAVEAMPEDAIIKNELHLALYSE